MLFDLPLSFSFSSGQCRPDDSLGLSPLVRSSSQWPLAFSFLAFGSIVARETENNTTITVKSKAYFPMPAGPAPLKTAGTKGKEYGQGLMRG